LEGLKRMPGCRGVVAALVAGLRPTEGRPGWTRAEARWDGFKYLLSAEASGHRRLRRRGHGKRAT